MLPYPFAAAISRVPGIALILLLFSTQAPVMTGLLLGSL